MSDNLKVLIADDNETDRIILRTIVRKEGYDVILAADGAEAFERFKSEKPDLVLLDVMMPVMDGMEAARSIRKHSPDDYIPIIFLTSLQDAESLAQCVDAGGDDFLSKPYNRVILKSKIKAFGRMREMHQKLQDHNRQMLIEQHFAKKIFDNVAHSGCLDSPNIQYSLSPMSVFNGDTVLAERRPDGGMHLFLGDFTGHGLPAAIGAMPLAEIFYGMTAKGFSMEDVLREINTKLHRILPTGVFCCGCFIELDFYLNKSTIWLGGLPDLVFHRVNTGEIETYAANNLPLGVLSREKFNPALQEIEMDSGDELFIWSDGIIEARNSQDELFGEERLQSLFKTVRADAIFKDILSAVDDFTGDADADDDVTLLSVKMVDIEVVGEPRIDSRQGSLGGPPKWQFFYALENESLRVFNPLPMVLNIISEVEGLRSLSGQLYTVIAELYSNALEHGVLKLSSELKASPEGFSAYYMEREKRLLALTSGKVTIRVSHAPVDKGKGGELIVSIEDSGEGFNHKKLMNKEMIKSSYCGRGLPLIQSLCSQYYYNEAGNIVTAHVIWS